MKPTLIFICAAFIVIAIYNIWALVTKRRTISSWFRQFFVELPFVPFALGVLCIGHFALFIDLSWMPWQVALSLFIVVDVIIIAWSFHNRFSKDKSKLYTFMCNLWGNLWYM
jgi:hypothetical protein